jgi:ribosomal protein L37AE/L43A
MYYCPMCDEQTPHIYIGNGKWRCLKCGSVHTKSRNNTRYNFYCMQRLFSL